MSWFFPEPLPEVLLKNLNPFTKDSKNSKNRMIHPGMTGNAI